MSSPEFPQDMWAKRQQEEHQVDCPQHGTCLILATCQQVGLDETTLPWYSRFPGRAKLKQLYSMTGLPVSTKSIPPKYWFYFCQAGDCTLSVGQKKSKTVIFTQSLLYSFSLSLLVHLKSLVGMLSNLSGATEIFKKLKVTQ